MLLCEDLKPKTGGQTPVSRVAAATPFAKGGKRPGTWSASQPSTSEY